MEDLFRVLSSRQEDDSPSISDFNTAQQRAFGVNGSLIIVIVFVMGVRLYTRFSITKSIGADDFMMICRNREYHTYSFQCIELYFRGAI
ncbi:hypothetical protein CCUS01_12481 [Colletotrichum cuscutae]|uniref:Uncharacterized protein n=1 Tax=Colletotrichum cuscutae TaxID=1209917 RepID=A0AAI9TU16_9PEZI|nr:hypothetical protein CCUS01_12481 [Colletotrichum cuscutae]